MTQQPHQNSFTISQPTPADTSAGSGTPISRNKGWLIAGTAVAALAGAALINRASARRAEAETPPAGKFVEVDGVRLHYVDRGQGPPVVLLHGNGVMLQDYEVSGVLGLAAAHHRVIAFDRPGFGYSERPRTTVWTPAAQAKLLARAIVKIGVVKPVVVGHSWGSIVALTMALDHPSVVGGLVLLSGYYYGTARPDVLTGIVPAIPVVGDVVAHTTGPLTGLLIGPAALKASFSPADVPDKFKRFPTALALRPSQIRATAADTALMVPCTMAISGRYGELKLPVIIMAGEGDLIAHVGKHAERLVGDIADAELRIVPGQGHLFHWAVPEQVVAAIDDATSQIAGTFV